MNNISTKVNGFYKIKIMSSPSLLIDLPDGISVVMLTEWCDPKEKVALDTAYCSIKQRKLYLNLIAKIGFQKCFELPGFIRWVVSRNVHLERLDLSPVHFSKDGNLLLPFHLTRVKFISLSVPPEHIERMTELEIKFVIGVDVYSTLKKHPCSQNRSQIVLNGFFTVLNASERINSIALVDYESLNDPNVLNHVNKNILLNLERFDFYSDYLLDFTPVLAALRDKCPKLTKLQLSGIFLKELELFSLINCKPLLKELLVDCPQVTASKLFDTLRAGGLKQRVESVFVHRRADADLQITVEAMCLWIKEDIADDLLCLVEGVSTYSRFRISDNISACLNIEFTGSNDMAVYRTLMQNVKNVTDLTISAPNYSLSKFGWLISELVVQEYACSLLELAIDDIGNGPANFTDFHFSMILQHCKQLHTLSLTNAHKITNKFLSDISNLSSSLTALNLTDCDRITTPNILKLLSKRGSTISSLSVHYCDGVDCEEVQDYVDRKNAKLDWYERIDFEYSQRRRYRKGCTPSRVVWIRPSK